MRRALRVPRRVATVLATVLAVHAGAVLLAQAAVAEEPVRTGWFSAAAAGPLVLPAPTTAEDDLRVTGGGERVTAYAALALAGTAGGTLSLDVVPGTALGTVELVGCAVTSDWEAGPNQPRDAGPDTDCDAARAFAVLTADGSSLELPLDAAFTRGGGLQVALLPLAEPDVAFSVELTAPVFTPAALPAPDPAAEPGTAAAPEGASAPDQAPPPAAPPALLPEGSPALPTDDGAGTAPPPEVLGAPEVPAEAPVAAEPPPLVLEPVPQVVPVAGTAAAGTEGGPRLLALLALVGVSAGAGYAAGQQRPAPRLLGGRARAGGELVPVAAPAVALPRAEQPRGIGRFSRVRDAAPRRLR